MAKHQFGFQKVSGNGKTGPIPVVVTSCDSCPNGCALKDVCYAKAHWSGKYWKQISDRVKGIDLDQLVNEIKALAKGQIWRCNEAGDLPSDGTMIDLVELGRIVTANRGRRGFTYTHHDMMIESNRQCVKLANDNGFTVNLSADNLEMADRLADLDIGPVVVLLPKEAAKGPKMIVTPTGRKVFICPHARGVPNIQCVNCGVCAVATRKSIVGFPAHGFNKNKATTIANNGAVK